MSDLNAPDVEALLGGRAPSELGPLAALVDRLRREASFPADPAMTEWHVAAAAAAAREGTVLDMAPDVPTRRLWRRRTVFAGLLSTIAGKIVIGVVAVAAAMAGAGATGVLPDSMNPLATVDQQVARLQEQVQEQVQQQDQDQDQAQNQDQNQDQNQTQNQTQTQDQNQNQNQTQDQSRQGADQGAGAGGDAPGHNAPGAGASSGADSQSPGAGTADSSGGHGNP
jgi:Mg-chelatase subunit ChlI